MVTSRMSYSLHCDIGRPRDHAAPNLDVDDADIPTLYVAVATWIPKCNMYNVESDAQEKNEQINDLGTIAIKDDPIEKDDAEDSTEVEETVTKNVDDTEDVEMVSLSKESDNDDKADENDESPSKDKDETMEESDLDTSIIVDSNVTPKKNLQDLIKGKTSSRKKSSEERLKSKEAREKKRQEEKDAKEKLKLEKIEQKIKERQEKEEQRKKEKIEKEEQKKKEKEEKDEQRRKEKEEKEEQKRKEKEERELKKQQEQDKDKIKMKKEAAAFVNFFVPRKSIGGSELKKLEDKEVTSYFMPFQVKGDMRLAPTTRGNLSKDQKEQLLVKMSEQNLTNLYLSEVKIKTLGKGTRTYPVEDKEVIVLEDTDIGECVEEQPSKNVKMRVKFLHFHENRRPAYFGTWRKKSKVVHPRKPLAVDKEIFDYDVDSDDDWEEEEPGESLHGSDDEEKGNESDEYEVDNDFFVPHGYLSDEEAENEENMELTPETQKEKLKILQLEFEEEMKSKTERIKPRLIGCIWESKLKPKIQDAINAFLEDRMMIINAPIILKKRELNKENNLNTGTKTSTPTRKQLNKEMIPDFLRMIHGNTNNKMFLVNEFLHFLSAQKLDKVSKSGLVAQLKELAMWKKCPDEGAMFNKHCWYVKEDVRKQYNLNLVLPNKWSYSEEHSNAKKKLSL